VTPALAPRMARAVVESVAAALALAAILVWLGACLVGSFGGQLLAQPYWPQAGGPRTDTSGVIAFAVLAAALVVSETLRVSRRRSGAPPKTSPEALARPVAALITGLAASALVTGTGLVIYLSVNTVTHPMTLTMHATHFATWPTEGTLRVVALALAALSTGWLRYVSIRYPGLWFGAIGRGAETTERNDRAAAGRTRLEP
jgi:hypothetical protein